MHNLAEDLSQPRKTLIGNWRENLFQAKIDNIVYHSIEHFMLNIIYERTFKSNKKLTKLWPEDYLFSWNFDLL